MCMKLIEKSTRDPLNLYKYYKQQNPDGELGEEFFQPKNPSMAILLNYNELSPDPLSRENMEYLINTVTSKVGGYKRLGYLKYCQPILATTPEKEGLTVWEVFTLEPFTKDWVIPYGFNKRLRATDKYKRWRTQVLSDKTHCQLCYKKESYLFAHHDPEFDALLKMFRIRCTDGVGNLDFRDAYSCKTLWRAEIGMAICEECHCKIHDWMERSSASSTTSYDRREPSNDVSNDKSNVFRFSYADHHYRI